MKVLCATSSVYQPRKQLLSAILLFLFAETALSLPADLDTGFNTSGFLLDNYTLGSASGRQNRPVLHALPLEPE